MVYRFTFISEEAESFLREIKISAEATFYELHETILNACDYNHDQVTSFFICNDEWELGVEITLEEMYSTSVEEDNFVMRNTVISELIEEERQRLVYRFDPLAERYFFIELSEILNGDQPTPICSRKIGVAPPQIQMDSDIESTMQISDNLSLDDDLFFAEEGYNTEEIDPEGFDISDEETKGQ